MNTRVPPASFSSSQCQPGHDAATDDETAEASGRRGPGRPTVCTPQMLGMLCGLVRELGLSPKAAAERLGLSLSSLTRWRRRQPEVALALKKSREECRAVHLQRIIEISQAANGKGWRASAWILERLFPEDYAPSATQREKFRALAERRQEEEAQFSEEAELEELMEAARESAAGSAADDEPAPNVDSTALADADEAENALPTSFEEGGQNGQNSRLAAVPVSAPPVGGIAHAPAFGNATNGQNARIREVIFSTPDRRSGSVTSRRAE